MGKKQNLDYYNNYYKYVNENFNLKNYRRMVLREHGDILKDKNKRVLEIGCGTGFLLMVLENEGFKDLTGVEIDTNQAKEAKKNITHSKIFNQDAFEFLTKAKDKYDIIFLYDLIEHIHREKIIILLKKIHDSLNKGGSLIIKTPNADSPFFSGRTRYIDFTHELLFNEESISMVLREAGFSEIKCRSPKMAPSYGKILSLPIRFLGNFILRLYLSTYIGKSAYDLRIEPNFIVTAKK